MILPFLLAAALGNPHCTTAGPHVTGAAVRSVTRDGDTDHYVVAITVTNDGTAQADNVLQAVDVLQQNVKVDQKSVPPLRAGASYTATYAFDRAIDAGNGSTHFAFRLDAAPTVGEDCNTFRFDV